MENNKHSGKTDQFSRLQESLPKISSGALDQFEKIARDINRNKELMRLALGPLHELRNTIRNSSHIVNSDLQETLSSIRALESNFRLQNIGEIQTLFSQINKDQGDLSNAVKDMFSHQNTIQEALKSMTKPWINTHDIIGSFRGFSQLQNIGVLLKEHPVFDEKTADILREDLGDWQNPIVWSNDIFTDPINRTYFYEERGFDTSLTNFPSEAFDEGLFHAGLVDQEYDEDGTLIEDQDLKRNIRAYERLTAFEMKIRRLIENKMLDMYGSKWVKQRVPQGVRENWQHKKEKAIQSGELDKPLIEYADFTDYLNIIIRSDNWKEIFSDYFIRQTFIQEAFQRLYPIRICTMHSRIITQDDELYLFVETKRIFEAIKAS